MKHTLVIVGAGLAGLSAALTAVKNGWTVKLVSSLASERAQSVMAEGGINAALNTKGEEDSPEQHYTDTLTAACGLADPNAVWGMTQAASELVRSLHHLGVQFNVTDDDELDLRNFGGQKKKRTAFAQSDTGKQLMTALIDAVRREESAGTVERFPHHKFRTLLLSGNICGGCTVQDSYTGELLRFVCDAVLIATGGLHGLFGDTTGSLANTGEVTAELFRLGVPMANLEMIQYHPTTVELGEKRMLLSEAARGEGGRLFALRNGKPWYFMEEKYPELGNLMPRDITAREVWTVSRDYEVFLDMTELPKEVMEHKLAGLVDDCQTYLHKDIRKEPIPILPGIHYFMGGIQVDERHRTSMRNLYAAGECCAQYHGANRLGGNSLLGAIYGGQIAAETACRETVSSPNMPCAEESLLPELSPDAQMQIFVKSETAGSSIDIDGTITTRQLTETEAASLFPNLTVTAHAVFRVDDTVSDSNKELIGFEGKIENAKVVISTTDITLLDTKIVGSEESSEVNGTSVTAGYFVTDRNSVGEQNVIYYATFKLGDSTVYVENAGAKTESESVKNDLATIIQELINNGALDLSSFNG